MHKIKRMARFIFLRVISGLISISMIVLSIVSNGVAPSYAQTSTSTQSASPPAAETTEESSSTGNADPAASVSMDTDKIRLIYQGDKDDLTDKDKIAAKYGDMYVLEYDTSSEAKQAKNRLKKDGSVGKEEIVRMATDSDFSKSEKETISAEDINNSIEKADDYSVPDYSGQNVIAVIDTGSTDQDIGSVSFIDKDAKDTNGHATRVEEAIREQNSDAQILSLKALDDNGNGTTASVIAALDYAMKAHVSIINLSFSGKATDDTKILESKIQEAAKAGIVVIGAAGNNNADASSYVPGNVSEILTIGAATADGNKVEDSNYGDAVDWYVTASSTSIAAAKATGIYSKEGKLQEKEGVVFSKVNYTIDSNSSDDQKDATTIISTADSGGAGGASGTSGGGLPCNVKWVLRDNNSNAFGWALTNQTSGSVNVAAVKSVINNVVGVDIWDLNRNIGGYKYSPDQLISQALTQAVNQCRTNYKNKYGTTTGFKPRIVAVGVTYVPPAYAQMASGRGCYNQSTNVADTVWNTAWTNIGNPTLTHNNQNYDKNTKSHNSNRSLTYFAETQLKGNDNIRIIVLDDTEPLPKTGNIKISKSADPTSYDNAGTLSYNSLGTDIGYQSDVSNGATSGVLGKSGPVAKAYGEGSIFGFNVKAPTGLSGTGTLQFRGHYAYEGWDQAFDTSTKKKYDKWYTAGGKEMSFGAIQVLDAADDSSGNPSGSGVQTYPWYLNLKGGDKISDTALNSQRWNLKYDSDGYAILYNASNPKTCLNQYGGKNQLKNGAKLVIYNYDGTDACKWKIEKTSDGAYIIRSKINPDFYINVSGDAHSGSSGQRIQMFNSGKGEANMKINKANQWNFFKISDNGTDLSIPSTEDALPEGTYYISAQDYALQALQMKLTGDWADKYDLYYQAYVSGSGWTDWAKNGATAGTIGTGKNVLGYRALIVNKANVTSSALKGAVYTVYSNANCTTSVGTITTDEYGQGELKDLEADKTYYIKETSAPSGFDLDPTVKSVKVNGGETVTVYSAEPPQQTGKIHITKSASGAGSITSLPSLAGAVYTVYSDSACKTSVGTITTDAKGAGELTVLANKTYYVKETKAPAGYSIDSKVYTATPEINTTVSIHSSDQLLDKKIQISKSLDQQKAGVLNYGSLIMESLSGSFNIGEGVNGTISGSDGSDESTFMFGFSQPLNLDGSGSLQFRGYYDGEGWDQSFDASTKKKGSKWYSSVYSFGADQVLDAAGDDNNNPSGSAIELKSWAPKGGNYSDATYKSQEWNLKYDSDGYAIFYSVSNPNLCLSLKGGEDALADGSASLQLSEYDGSDACKWKIEGSLFGFVIYSKVDSEFCINVNNGSIQVSDESLLLNNTCQWNFLEVSDDGTELVPSSNFDSDNKKWSEGTYYISKFSPLKAMQVKLTGDWANKYDINYQVYVDGNGWTDWVKNGETAGMRKKDMTNLGDVLAYRAYIVSKEQSAFPTAVKGAVYTVYSDSSCTQKVGTITVDEEGNGEATVPYAGTYYVKETSAPEGLELNTDIMTISTSADKDEYTLSTSDKVKEHRSTLSTTASISGFTPDDKQSIKTDSVGHSVYTIDNALEAAKKYKNKLPKITDTLHYSGLEAGRTYKVVSTLYDKETGDQIKLANNADTITSLLTPTSESGDFTVTFDNVNIYNQSLYKERSNTYPYYRNIVIYEEIIDLTTGNTVVIHKDQNDENQSLYLQIKSPNTDTKTTPLANTGGTGGWMLLVLILLGGIYVGLRNKKDING